MRLALNMIDELLSWGASAPVMVGDGAYGNSTELRSALEQRNINYVLDFEHTTSANSEAVQRERPSYRGRRGQPPRWRATNRTLHRCVSLRSPPARTPRWRCAGGKGPAGK